MISGWWTQGNTPPEAGNQAVKAAIYRVTKPIFLINMNGKPAVGNGGTILIGDLPVDKSNGYPL